MEGGGEWVVVHDDERELYEVLHEAREDGALRVYRRRVTKADGLEYGDLLELAPPPAALVQRNAA